MDCVYTSCVDVCPVEAFHEAPDRLLINPDTCIDCDACVPECPVEAIVPDTEPDTEEWLKINTEYSEKWPNITLMGVPPEDADEHKGEEGKFEKFFNPEPGEGD